MSASRRLARPALLVLALGLSSAALAQTPPAPPATAQPSEPRRLAVTGEGQATRAPDLALVQLTVMRQGETAQKALADNNAAMSAVQGALPEFGLEARDVQTSGFSIAPQYRYDTALDGTQSPPTLVGYEVRNTITLRVRAVDRLGEILDRAVSLGVNDGGSIEFAAEDPSALQNEARRQAVERARASAEAMAAAAGLRLGALISIEDGATGAAPPRPLAEMRMMAAPASPKVPVAAGETMASASVRLVFALEN
ncbi:SIMPL domain-containing protein [Aureimonas sp. AU4]|uniref:SIMPL domain-containing protein n=1 Tax=Aureimonas sp. AU4 TaxID=1638163 RepID=UPI0007863C6A|nr:SIMPL domain-containing protein [Aureimonas sp. AU4]